MTILETIKSDLNQARSNKSGSLATISTIYAEILSIGKNDGNRETTDAEAIKYFKKLISNNNETISLLKSRGDVEKTKSYEDDISYIEDRGFIPTAVDMVTVEAEIDDFINQNEEISMRDMGKLMGILKQKFDGNYDGGAVSSMVKQKLSR